MWTWARVDTASKVVPVAFGGAKPFTVLVWVL